YLAYTAPHWPLQAPDEYLAKYRGKYDQGYDQLRVERFKRQQALGLVAKRARLPSMDSTAPPWNSLSGDEQRQQSRIMEVYAAMIANMDANIGRLIAYLQERGELDNTIILFVSDNGPEGGRLKSDLFKE